jgi:hypothetical protein
MEGLYREYGLLKRLGDSVQMFVFFCKGEIKYRIREGDLWGSLISTVLRRNKLKETSLPSLALLFCIETATESLIHRGWSHLPIVLFLLHPWECIKYLQQFLRKLGRANTLAMYLLSGEYNFIWSSTFRLICVHNHREPAQKETGYQTFVLLTSLGKLTNFSAPNNSIKR